RIMSALPSHESKPMSEPGKSIFRNALQVSHERIAAMSDDDLNKLMAQLLNAQARRCGSPIGEIRTKRVFEKSCQFQLHRICYRLHPSCPEAGVATYSTTRRRTFQSVLGAGCRRRENVL